jgi:hypothetical protein
MLNQLETPVSDTEAREHGRLISHLKNVLLPGAYEAAEAAEVAEAVEAISDAKLPNSIADTITRIREGMAVRPGSKVEAKVKEAGLVRLRAHLHAISQGQTQPKIDYGSFLKSLRTPNAEALEYFTTASSKSKSKRG